MKVTCYGTGSTGNCYLVETSSGKFILDLGLDPSVKVNLNDVDFAFVSHEHNDHSKYIPKIASRGVFMIDWKTNRDFTKIVLKTNLDSKYSVFTFPVVHGDVDCRAIIVIDKATNEKLLYMTDLTICKYDLSDFEFDYIIIECDYLKSMVKDIHSSYIRVKENINRHLDLDGCIMHLEKMNLVKTKEIILCHKSSSYGDPIEFGSKVYSRFNIPTGVCKRNGGIDWYGKEFDF